MTRPDYDVVVVGAGLLGCSAALHLIRRGVKRVAVVDAVGPGDATTGAGAGFVGTWAAGYAEHCDNNEIDLEIYGIDFYRSLAERHDIDLRTNGNLFVARTEQGWEDHVSVIAGHPLAPRDTREVSAGELEVMSSGAIAAGQVYRGVFHPGGIQIDTTPAVTAIAALLTELGADLLIGRPVTELLVDAGSVTGVWVDGGPLRARWTVLAAGAWTNQLLADVGMQLPLVGEVASRVISPSSGIPSTLPTVMVPEMQWLWAREHRGGLTYGNVVGYEIVDSPQSQGLPAVTGNRPRDERLLEAMVLDLTPGLRQLFPQLDPTVLQWRQGVVTHTPDALFCVGPVPGVDRLFALAGCNEGGVTHGPGLGRVLADLVIDGQTSFVDASRYRLDRFSSAVRDP